MAKAPGKYACAYCGERFAKMGDHMTHVLQSHKTGQRARGERLTRSISCWRCGTVDLYPSGADNWYYCECGWKLPRNWVNGQLTKESPNNAEGELDDNGEQTDAQVRSKQHDAERLR